MWLFYAVVVASIAGAAAWCFAVCRSVPDRRERLGPAYPSPQKTKSRFVAGRQMTRHQVYADLVASGHSLNDVRRQMDQAERDQRIRELERELGIGEDA